MSSVKSYLAENMQDIPIRDLILNEQQVETPGKASGFSYIYWFSAKNAHKWTKFSEDYPKCEWVWISDYKKVVLQHATNLHNLDPSNKNVWAEAKIIFPQVPKLPRHSCLWNKTGNEWFCDEQEDDSLELVGPNRVHDRLRVKFCPFCGFEGKSDG